MANASTNERTQGRDPTYWLSSVVTLFGVLITGLFVFMTFRIDRGARYEAQAVAQEAITEARREAREAAERIAVEEARKIAVEEARKIAVEEARKIAEEKARAIAREEAEKIAKEEARKTAVEKFNQLLDAAR